MEAGSDVILSISGVSKAFPGVKALDGVSLEVRRGTVHGLVGENGAGKSTLMKILSGVYTKDGGTVVFDGQQIEHTTPHQSMERGLAIIYQELNLVNSMSVGENVFLGRFRETKGMRGTHARARELLDSIGCTVSTTRLVSELSVSEKQMVEIAKALSFQSKLIIMDEPSSSLTGEELVELAKIIKQLKAQGISIIYISHKLAEIFEFCDVVSVMRDGRIVDTKPRTEFTRNELITKMVGRTIENEYPPRPQCVGAPLMEVRGLRTRKLHDVSFNLHRGEILGLVGLVGAGRTEIVRALFGADKVRGHQILIEGQPVDIRNPKDAKDAGLGFIPEDRKLQGLVLPFSVEANISMACIRKFSRLGFLQRSAEKSIAARQAKALAVKTPSTRTRVETLSGGNQQKCIVGRWMELAPRIFIMDEPTRGIDVGAKYEIYSLMKEIAERGGAIILISSELPEVLNMSNRVLTIFEGRLTGEFDPVSATADEIMSAALGMTQEPHEGKSGAGDMAHPAAWETGRGAPSRRRGRRRPSAARAGQPIHPASSIHHTWRRATTMQPTYPAIGAGDSIQGALRAGARQLQEHLVLVMIAALVVVTAAVEPKFMSPANLVNIMRQFGPLIMVSLGMTFVIIGGFIDLSVAGTINLVAVVTISLIQPMGQVPALLVGLAIGAGCGAMNAVLILTSGALTQAEALFITFGMSTVYSALALLYSHGATLHFWDFPASKSVFEAIGAGNAGPLSVSFVIFLASLAVLWVFQAKTVEGRAIKLTGGNKVAARLAGVNVSRAVVVIYTVCGFMAGVGAIVLFSRITTAAPVIGAGYETNAILAVVVGGTTLRGGNGGVLRTVVGVLLVTLMANCLDLLNVSTYLQVAVKGAILVFAIWLDNRKNG